MKLQKLAGYACIILILSGIASTSLLIGLFRDFTELDIYDPVKMMAAYDSSTASFLIYYVLGIISAVFTLLIVVALAERMRAGAPQLMRLAVIGASAYFALRTTTMIGGFFRNILLAQTNDLSAFRTFLVLHEFLGYAASSLLGWGLLCVACAALATRSLPRLLSCIILIFSILLIIGFVFAVTGFTIGTAILTLVTLIVFVWLGIVLLWGQQPMPAETGVGPR